jgi:hypothetical protein
MLYGLKAEGGGVYDNLTGMLPSQLINTRANHRIKELDKKLHWMCKFMPSAYEREQAKQEISFRSSAASAGA